MPADDTDRMGDFDLAAWQYLTDDSAAPVHAEAQGPCTIMVNVKLRGAVQ